MPDSVFISAPGIVCPLGHDRQTVAERLFAGDQSGLCIRPTGLPGRQQFCGVVQMDLPSLSSTFAAYACRNNQLLTAASEQVRAQIEHVLQRFGSKKVAVVVGSSTSGIAEGGDAVKHWMQEGSLPPHYHFKQQEIGAPAEFLAAYWQIKGPAYTVSTACTSSTKAFASARRLLRSKMVDAVVVAGADSLCELTLNGFASLESTSDGLCQPFAATRNGINIGEGAAVFVMTRDEGDVALTGVGEGSDAYHISSPEPNGSGAEHVMRAALDDAGLTANDISYINLHGTATRKNDEMEARAVSRVFGSEVYCSSTKAMTGHLLGAAGATELAYCYFTLGDSARRLPPQISAEYDHELPPIALVKRHQTSMRPIHHVMTCNYAFGGSNAALIISKRES